MKSRKINCQGIASLILGIVGLLFSCIFLGSISSSIGLLLGIWGIAQKDKSKGSSIVGIVCSAISIFICVILFVLSIVFCGTGNAEMINSTAEDTEDITEIESENLIKNEDENDNVQNECEQDQATKNDVVLNVREISEVDFKNSCVEIIYNDLNEEWIGKCVTKELLFDSVDTGTCECGATEDFVEEVNGYQHTYRIYRINDKRFDKSFLIYPDDVIRVYGVIKDVYLNYSNGLYYPVIDVYYADYIRKWRNPIDETKTIDEIIEERKIEKEKQEAEEQYCSSLNSDYTGKTKNVDDMNALLLEEYINYCDKMNYKDLYGGGDFTGRFVSIHVQLFSHKIFKSEQGKENKLGEWTDIQYVQDDVWEIELYSEQAEDYIADFGTIYFLNKENISPHNLEKGENLVLYGQIIHHPKETYDDWELLVRYYEKE